MPNRSEGSDTGCVTSIERRTPAHRAAGSELHPRNGTISKRLVPTDFDQFVTLVDESAVGITPSSSADRRRQTNELSAASSRAQAGAEPGSPKRSQVGLPSNRRTQMPFPPICSKRADARSS